MHLKGFQDGGRYAFEGGFKTETIEARMYLRFSLKIKGNMPFLQIFGKYVRNFYFQKSF